MHLLLWYLAHWFNYILFMVRMSDFNSIIGSYTTRGKYGTKCASVVVFSLITNIRYNNKSFNSRFCFLYHKLQPLHYVWILVFNFHRENTEENGYLGSNGATYCFVYHDAWCIYSSKKGSKRLVWCFTLYCLIRDCIRPDVDSFGAHIYYPQLRRPI